MAKSKGNMPYPTSKSVPEGFRKTSGASAINSDFDLYTKGSRFNGTYQAVLVPKKTKR